MKKPGFNQEKNTVGYFLFRVMASLKLLGYLYQQLILSWHQFVESLYSACLAYYEARQVGLYCPACTTECMPVRTFAGLCVYAYVS